MVKTRELCAEIAGNSKFLKLQENVERFLNDDASRLQYQSVHERGEELHQKQHAGVQLGAAEIREFEAAREALFENEIARDFLSAQQELDQLMEEGNKVLKNSHIPPFPLIFTHFCIPFSPICILACYASKREKDLRSLCEKWNNQVFLQRGCHM